VLTERCATSSEGSRPKAEPVDGSAHEAQLSALEVRQRANARRGAPRTVPPGGATRCLAPSGYAAAGGLPAPPAGGILNHAGAPTRGELTLR